MRNVVLTLGVLSVMALFTACGDTTTENTSNVIPEANQPMSVETANGTVMVPKGIDRETLNSIHSFVGRIQVTMGDCTTTIDDRGVNTQCCSIYCCNAGAFTWCDSTQAPWWE